MPATLQDCPPNIDALVKLRTCAPLPCILCSNAFENFLTPEDILEITRRANQEGIALELNCANLKNGKTCLANLEAMLSACTDLYVNSDAHTLHEFIETRKLGFAYLKDNGWLK